MDLNTDIIFDIETEALPDEHIRKALPPYPPFSDSTSSQSSDQSDEEAAKKLASEQTKHDRLESEYWAKAIDKAALSPITGRVLTIAYLKAGAPWRDAVIEDCDGDECELLTRFWNGYRKLEANRGHYIGWNSGGPSNDGFDIPFIVRRSWLLGLEVPTSVYHKRFLSDVFQDLMSQWECFGFKKFAKLDACARALGIGNKTDQEVSGAEFARYWRGSEYEHILAKRYGLLDVILTRSIHLRLNHPRDFEDLGAIPPIEDIA